MFRTAFKTITVALCLTLGAPPAFAASPRSRPPGGIRSQVVATRPATARRTGPLPGLSARPATSSDAPADYVLGPEDVISVAVLHQPDFGSNDQEIDPKGRISLPLLGSVRAAGSSTDLLVARRGVPTCSENGPRVMLPGTVGSRAWIAV